MKALLALFILFISSNQLLGQSKDCDTLYFINGTFQRVKIVSTSMLEIGYIYCDSNTQETIWVRKKDLAKINSHEKKKIFPTLARYQNSIELGYSYSFTNYQFNGPFLAHGIEARYCTHPAQRYANFIDLRFSGNTRISTKTYDYDALALSIEYEGRFRMKWFCISYGIGLNYFYYHHIGSTSQYTSHSFGPIGSIALQANISPHILVQTSFSYTIAPAPKMWLGWVIFPPEALSIGLFYCF